MSHVIKINCGELHRTPAFGCMACRLGPLGGSWWGRHQPRGPGKVAQPARDPRVPTGAPSLLNPLEQSHPTPVG